jgi:hypothetical protein
LRSLYLPTGSRTDGQALGEDRLSKGVSEDFIHGAFACKAESPALNGSASPIHRHSVKPNHINAESNGAPEMDLAS